MNHFFIDKWAVEQQMRCQFETSDDQDREPRQVRTETSTLVRSRHRLGTILHILADLIEPKPTARSPHAS